MAVLAGGPVVRALALGVAMVLLQASIGTVNDVVDSPLDAGRKPGKPIPAGLVSPGQARAVAVAAGAAGLVLTALATRSVAVVAIGVAILGIGLLYDLRLRGTALSWLPFALGIPLLPVYAWLGAVGAVPPAFGILVPAAFLAGAALAIANGLADLERDEAAGSPSVAVTLGRESAWLAHAALHAAVVALAATSAVAAGRPAPLLAGLIAAAAVLGVGVLAARSLDPARRERGWEIEAVAVAGLALTWLAGLAPRLG
ncbi:MAG: UbiA family prenyltransferase [Chloroflexota bacterium]